MTQVEQIRQISPQDLLNLGIGDVAYIRPMAKDGTTVYVVCTADGRDIVALPSREAAEVVIRQHELEPVTLQ